MKRSGGRGREHVVLLVALLALAAGLRLAAWPARDEVRSVDELGYLSGGLVLLEGLPPSHRFAPAAVTTWTTWLLTAGEAFGRLALDRSGAPAFERAFDAIEGALVAGHADPGGLRRVVLVVSLVLSLAAVWACHRLGACLAGWPGALACGGLAAALPIFVRLAAEARPYAPAWSLALLAAGAAATARPGLRRPASAVLLGLSVACRIEMVAFAPVVCLLPWIASPALPGSVREVARAAAGWSCGVAVTTVVAAPWLVTQFLGNLRVIVTVRFYSHRLDVPWERNDLLDLALGEGLIVAVALTFFGVPFSRRRGRVVALACAGLMAALLASVAFGTAYGLRHQGPTLVALVTLTPLGLAALRTRAPRELLVAVACLASGWPTVQALREVAAIRQARPRAHPLEWVERHVPAGATLYWPSFELATPWPTAESGDRLWREVAAPGAWRRKVERAAADHGLDVRRMPRALSRTHVVQDQGIRRRWFLLAGAGPDGPRHDVVPWSDMSPFDVASRDLPRRLAATGGDLLWRGPPIVELEPAVEVDESSGLRLYLAPARRAAPTGSGSSRRPATDRLGQASRRRVAPRATIRRRRLRDQGVEPARAKASRPVPPIQAQRNDRERNAIVITVSEESGMSTAASRGWTRPAIASPAPMAL